MKVQQYLIDDAGCSAEVLQSFIAKPIEMDVTKIRPQAYQFTAIDDCTRMKVIRIYLNKKADSTIDFLGEA